MSPLEHRLALIEDRCGVLEARCTLLERELAAARSRSVEANPTRSVEPILAAVCAYYGLSRDQVLSDRKLTQYVDARHLTMFLARTNTNLSLGAIAEGLQRTDHGTVLHAVKRVESLLAAKDRQMTQAVTAVREAIKIDQPEIVKAA